MRVNTIYKIEVINNSNTHRNIVKQSAGDLKKAKTKISSLEKEAAALTKKLGTTEGALQQSHAMIESLKKQVEELRNELTKRKKAAEAKLKMEINKVTEIWRGKVADEKRRGEEKLEKSTAEISDLRQRLRGTCAHGTFPFMTPWLALRFCKAFDAFVYLSADILVYFIFFSSVQYSLLYARVRNYLPSTFYAWLLFCFLE